MQSRERAPLRRLLPVRKGKKQLHPDIYEYSAPGGANSFHIDKIRDIIADVYITPNEADYKIYILGNAHCMNENAQNALLKILEEPPGYAVFILTAENRSALLETVLSRAVVISVEGVSPKLGAEFITGLNEDVDYNDAYNAVAALGGNIGRAYESIAGGRLQKLTALVDDIAQSLPQTMNTICLRRLLRSRAIGRIPRRCSACLKPCFAMQWRAAKGFQALTMPLTHLKANSQSKSFLRFIMPRRSLSRLQIKMPIRHCSQQKSAIRCEERQADRRII